MASTPISFFYNCEAPLASLAASLLRRCASSSTLREARQLHALVLVATPRDSPPFLRNNLLSLYSKCGSLDDARKLFVTMPTRNLVTYNAMISAYSKSPRHAASALRLFGELSGVGLRPNASTFPSVVRAAPSLEEPLIGRSMHCKIITFGFGNNLCVQTALLGMYSDLGIHEAAMLTFAEMGKGKDAVAWNAIIVSSVKNDEIEQGLSQFGNMFSAGVTPNNCTLTIVFSACGKAMDRKRGQVIHGKMIMSELQPDLPLQNALIDMYSSFGDMSTALLVFKRTENPDLVSWNSVIAGYSSVGEGTKAMNVFTELLAVSPSAGLRPDEYTFAAVVSATASLSSMCYGEPLHAQVIKLGFESSIFVGNTLINMYFMNNEPGSARTVFSFVREKDVVVWTEMVAGHSRLGEGELAMIYLRSMLAEGHKVDSFSLSSALKSSGDLAVLKQGEMLYSLVVKAGYETNICVCGSLVDMYSKNGDLDSASAIFYRTKDPDLICWNSIIGGFGNCGNAEHAFVLFNKMVEKGLQPDHVTYVSLLSTCIHRRLVERGRFYWFCMMTDGITPSIKHFTCMVNLLSRAGLLQEAEDFIARSPFVRFPELWRILLSSCIIFRNLSIGLQAAERILTFAPEDSSTYIMLSNLYASTGRWDDVVEMRKKIRELMLVKDPGVSWVEINGMVHVFSADDGAHPLISECKKELIRLKGNLEGPKLSKSQNSSPYAYTMDYHAPGLVV